MPHPGFTQRIGEAVFAPSQAARRLCQGGPGGLKDAAWLLLLRVLAWDLQRLVLGAVRVQDEGMGALLGAVVQALQMIVPDVLGILAGGVAMGLLLGNKERFLRPGLALDLTAQAWIGWLYVRVLASLGLTLLQHDPGWRLSQLIQIAGILSFGILWMISLHQAHKAATAAAEAAAASTET